MEKKTTYHEQTSINNTVKLREVLATLPDFCRNYFRAMEPKSSARTRINYATNHNGQDKNFLCI